MLFFVLILYITNNKRYLLFKIYKKKLNSQSHVPSNLVGKPDLNREALIFIYIFYGFYHIRDSMSPNMNILCPFGTILLINS